MFALIQSQKMDFLLHVPLYSEKKKNFENKKKKTNKNEITINNDNYLFNRFRKRREFEVMFQNGNYTFLINWFQH